MSGPERDPQDRGAEGSTETACHPSDDQNRALCSRIRKNDQDAFQELLKLHEGLVREAVRRAKGRLHAGPSRARVIEGELTDPLKSTAMLGLWHAAQAWPGDGPFASYALVSMLRAATDEGYRLLGLGESLDAQNPNAAETPGSRLRTSDLDPEERLLLDERLAPDDEAVTGLSDSLRQRRTLPPTPTPPAAVAGGIRVPPARHPLTLRIPARTESTEYVPEASLVETGGSPYGLVFDAVAEEMRLVALPRLLMEQAQDEIARRLQGAAFAWTDEDGTHWLSPFDDSALACLREKGVLAIVAQFVLIHSHHDPGRIDRASRRGAIRRLQQELRVHEELERVMRRVSDAAARAGDQPAQSLFDRFAGRDARTAKDLTEQLDLLRRTDRRGKRGPVRKLPAGAVLRAEVDTVTNLAEGWREGFDTASGRERFVRSAFVKLGIDASQDDLWRVVARLWRRRPGYRPPTRPGTVATELVGLVHGVTRDRVRRLAR